MNKFGLALALLALVAAPYSYALEIFSMDCNGGFRYLPSYPIGGQFDYSSFLGVADTFLSVYKDRLKCLCADLTDDEFNRLFHPFFGADMAFNIMQGPNADLSLSKCSWSAFDSVSWMRADKFDSKAVDLTSTCSYDTWTRDGKCMLQSQTFSDWDVTVKVGLFKCQSAPWRPAVSLICEGKGCEQAFIPCMSDSDCAGNMQCKEFIFNNMARPTTDDMLTAFKSILRADDLTSSCVNTNDIVRTTVDLIRKMWKQDSATYTSSQAKICSPIELNFWTNMTFNWEDLIHYTPSSVVTTNTSVSVPGYLQPWNGNLLSGGIMSAPQNVGAKPTNVPSLTPGGTLIFQKSCDGTFTMLPSAAFGMSFDFGVSHTMIDHWVSIISPILKCRFQNLGLSIGDQEMRNRWGLGLDWLFFNVDADHARDSLTGNLLDYGLRLSSRVDLPSTCNYDSWVKEGLCRAQYTGLGDLLGVDATANIEVKKCGSSSDVSLTVECAGAACSLLSLKTKPCNSNSDCPNSLTCQDLNPKLGTYDWMNAYIGINGTKTPSCSRSQDAIHAEVRKLALSFLGMQYDGSSDNKYCMIDYDHVVSQGSTWAKGEVDTDSTPGVVKLKNLKAWDGSAGNTPVTSSGVTTALNYALGALAVVLAVFY